MSKIELADEKKMIEIYKLQRLKKNIQSNKGFLRLNSAN